MFDARAAAMDKRIAGIIMFLPCIDGAWDKFRWSESLVETSTGQKGTLWDVVQRNRFHTSASSSATISSSQATNTPPITAEEEETITFWPLTPQSAHPTTGSAVLSGSPYIHAWSLTAQLMAEQGSNASPFTGSHPQQYLGQFFHRPVSAVKSYRAYPAPVDHGE